MWPTQIPGYLETGRVVLFTLGHVGPREHLGILTNNTWTTVSDLSGIVVSGQILRFGCRDSVEGQGAGPRVQVPEKVPSRCCQGRLDLFFPMVDSKLLVPELNEAETMGAETACFEELLLQVRTDPDFWVPRYLVGLFVFRNGTTVPRMH